jgi:hypothetical protein
MEMMTDRPDQAVESEGINYAAHCDNGMTDAGQAVSDMAESPVADGADRARSSRRQLLIGGAVAASAIVSIRPALAQTAASVLHCQVPVPDPARGSQLIAADGSLVAPGTPGAFPGASRPFTAEEVKAAIRSGRMLPGTTYNQNSAYLNYIRRLQQGTSGFTCYASLQMPR